jgi:signal transduction histidine kinase/CheY-like chemotaxis protein/HPt (histidine-containing phosphotransfer) domain-containing protein
MLDKSVHYMQQSAVLKFFIVNVLVAVVLIVSGHFSVLIVASVALSALPPLAALGFFDDKLTYDQKQQIKTNALLLSSILWAVFMWKGLQDFPVYFSIVFVVCTTAALLFFQSLKIRLVIVTPLLIAFSFLVIVFLNQSSILLAITAIVFVLIFLFLKVTGSDIGSNKRAKSNESVSSDKMDLISELDSTKTENQKLKESIKQTEIDLSAAEMAKMEFLATMSHEIRTPLNGIIPLLDILLDSELSDFQKDYLSTAHVSAIQMQKLIDDLLDYSKVEAGKLTVETRGLKIQRILGAVNASYQQAAQKKNIAIEVDVHKNVSPLLRGDPTRLRQVLSNLLSNAIKFSSAGTIKLVAKKIKYYPNKEVIRFEVVDQGIGLDKETSENIFLPFTQEDGSSTRKFGGTGLGLAISKKIVELMNGTIGVDSEKGKGSTFYFDLPLLKSVGETSVGLSETSGYQAILVNTNPLLFNKISKKLKQEEIPFQKALGISQAYDIYGSITKISKETKNILVFIDFETAGKQARGLCNDLNNDDSMTNLIACVLTENKNIAGIPKQDNIKLISKNEPIAELLNKIEVAQASMEASQEKEREEEQQRLEQERLQANGLDENQETATVLPEILLVEDNEVNLKVAEKLIQYIGYPFDFAMNGQEALEKVKENRYRMILMDCQMPVMDGYRCTSRIRDYEAAAGLNRTPILAMTANAMMGDREKCLDSGMDDYMSKPLNRYILEKTLKKWDPLVQAPTPKFPDSTKLKVAQTPKLVVAEEEVEETNAPAKVEPIIAPKPPAEINQKWLSTKALEEIKEFMGNEIVQLLEMFEQETPTILSKIKTSLQNNNFDEVKKMAHMLKSTSANIGANGLSFFSRKLELASDTKDRNQIIGIFNKIVKAHALTKNEIVKYKQSQ